MNTTNNPVPFRITREPGEPLCATNGSSILTVLDEGGELKLRRAITGIGAKPSGERVLPMLNQLAGEILGNLEMPAQELAERLRALAMLAQPIEPKRVEWAMAELNGVKVYFDGVSVVVTTRDLTP